MIKMAPMAIDCPDAGCDFGENNAKYKTPVMEPALAMELMKIHGQGHQKVQGAVSGPISIKNMRERQKKPTTGMGMSKGKWRDFMNQMRDHRQGETEKVRAFVARVYEATIDCKFEVQCNEDLCVKMVSNKEEFIRDQCVFVRTLRPKYWP